MLMKNTSATQYLLSAIGLWLLSQQCGQCFYEPGVQRWINRDPIQESGGNNLFRFVLNEPMEHLDALGLQIILWPRERVPPFPVPIVYPRNPYPGLPLSKAPGFRCTATTAKPEINLTICHKTDDWPEPDPRDPSRAERLCKYKCDDGQVVTRHGPECDERIIVAPGQK
jgi:RHS repeat-associated protein